jgi:hypothetical protein
VVNPLWKIEISKGTRELDEQSHTLVEQARTLLAVGVGWSTLYA